MAQRKNRHILETAGALLIGTSVPSGHWDDAVGTAVHLLNRMPSKVLEFKTPLQALGNHFTLPSSSLVSPRVFGCVVFVHLHKHQRTKLDPCAVRCVFFGYATNTKGYRCYDPTTKHYYTTMDATFLESEHYYSSSPTTSHLQGEIRSEDMKWWDCQVAEDADHGTLLNDISINVTEDDGAENTSHDALVDVTDNAISDGVGNDAIHVNISADNDAICVINTPLSCTRRNDTP